MTPSEAAALRALYDRRLPDTRIASAAGISRQSVRAWRFREGLPALFQRGSSLAGAAKITPEVRARIVEMLKKGQPSRAVAKALGCTPTTVQRIRRKLPANTPGLLQWGGQPVDVRIRLGHGRCRANRLNGISPMVDPLYARIRDAVGRGVPRDLADDAISDIYVAVLEGRLDPANIKREAYRYVNRTFAANADRFGPISLDEKRGEDGWSMMDLIPDRSAAAAFDLALHRGLESRMASFPAIPAAQLGLTRLPTQQARA